MLTIDPPVAFNLDDGPFRYLSFVRWGPGPTIGWLLDHPRPADRHDKITGWLRAHAQSCGFGAIEVAWLYAWRSYTTPIVFAYPDHRGEHNDEAIRFVCRRHLRDALVLGWGDGASEEAIDRALAIVPRDAMVLGRTHNGNPVSPSPRIGYDAPMLRAFPRARGRA